jgi:hypothetical protein
MTDFHPHRCSVSGTVPFTEQSMPASTCLPDKIFTRLLAQRKGFVPISEQKF